MSLTRFYDDDARVKKQLEESLNVGLYHLDVPGNGLAPPFMEDRQIRLQKWGANLRTNTIDIDNDLKGLRTKLKNDKKEYTKNAPYSRQLYYTSQPKFIDESRTTLPAWTFRDKPSKRWDYSFHDVQNHTEVPFNNNESSRYTFKENFMRTSLLQNNNK
jgi:hypothetical protein